MKILKLVGQIGKLWAHKKWVNIENIGDSYTAISQSYEAYFLKEMHQYNHKVLDSLIKHSKPDMQRVLDLACGTGYNSYYLAKEYLEAQYCLVDISKGMLEKAKEKEIAHVMYKEQDMLGFLKEQAADSFDMVVCCWAIKYQSPHKIIEEVHRILKPGGTFGVIVNTKATLPEIRHIYPKLLISECRSIQEIMLELPNPKNKKCFLNWFRQKGFQVLEEGEGRHCFKFLDTKELVEWVTHTGALAGFDCMIDLKQAGIQEQMSRLLEEERIDTVTHTFVWGTFQKKEEQHDI